MQRNLAVGTLLLAGVVAAGALACGSSEPSGPVRVVEIELGEMYISPSELTVEAGERVQFRVTNTGLVEHDMRVERGREGTRMLNPGEQATFEAGPFEGHTVFICTVPGHAAAGMLMDLDVARAAP